MITFQGIALLLSNSREVMMHGELDFFKANLIEGAKDPSSGLNLIITPYVIIFFVVVVLGWLLLTFTKYGRRVFAVGSNESAAYLAGVNVRNIKLSAYAINGFLVGVGSIMMLARINVGIITLGQGLEIDTIAMAVIGGTALSGGKGNIWGTFFGVLLLGSIGNAMNMLRLPPEVQYIAKGVIIILAVTLGTVYANLSSSVLRLNKSTLLRRDKK
jgi:ribose/xylose/arabinose/galactoside ABC-type transport system permease subunit